MRFKTTHMPDSTTNSSRDLRWPPERFYWSIVESTAPRPAGWADPDTIGALAEDDVPIAASDTRDDPSDSSPLHAAYARLDDRRLLVCAVERAHLDEVPPSTLTLAPSALPECLGGEAAIDPATLNLLVGPFEPREVRRARSTRHAVSTLGAIAATTLLCLGLARHTDALRTQTRTARVEATSLVTQALGRSTAKPPIVALNEELERIRLAGTRPSRVTHDAALALDHVLAAWPAGCTPTMLAVSPDAITANVVVEDRAVLNGLVAPIGFEAKPPRLSRVERGTSVALRWTRVQNAQLIELPIAPPIAPKEPTP